MSLYEKFVFLIYKYSKDICGKIEAFENKKSKIGIITNEVYWNNKISNDYDKIDKFLNKCTNEELILINNYIDYQLADNNKNYNDVEKEILYNYRRIKLRLNNNCKIRKR